LEALKKDIENTEEKVLTTFTDENYPDLDEVLFHLQRTKTAIPEGEYFEPFERPYLRFCSYVKDYFRRESDITNADIEHIEELSEDVWNTFAYALRLSTDDELSKDELERIEKDYKSNLSALDARIRSLEGELESIEVKEDSSWDEVISNNLRR
jgi:hypothetical protein